MREPTGTRAALAVYTQPRLVAVLLMGFASGLPFALTTSTLGVWLTESGRSFTSIGLFGLVGLPYSLKFIWAPLVDRLTLPMLTRRLGRRRSWLIATEICLITSIVGLGMSDPSGKLAATAGWAVAVGFFSASQDIVIDAYRVELLAAAEQGAGAAATQFGYRLGLLASGAGALYAATSFGWAGAYELMAVLMLIGAATALATPEPAVTEGVPPGHWFETAVLLPFRDFLRHGDWLMILLFILFYRLGSAVADHMAAPFYISLGFSRNEYAGISKVFGVLAAMGGVALGGIAVYRLGAMRALLLGGVLQIISNLTYIVQNWAGHDLFALACTIGVENVSAGMCGAAFVAYLSGLCNRAYTATQYALLSALAPVAYRLFGSAGGAIVDWIGWTPFFVLSASLVLPSLILLLWLMHRHQPGSIAVPISS
jgi:PAT family beta-lactamase induction signal transducer AmpG